MSASAHEARRGPATHPRKLTWKLANRLIREHTEEVAAPELVERPLVTACLITYNHARFIRQALDGMLDQRTTFPFEILVSDDASSDGTREIVREYQARHPSVIRLLLSRTRLGSYTGNGRLSLIRCLQRARGQYIALLEGDDYWCCAEKLELQVGHLTSGEYAGVFHDTRNSYPDEGGRTEAWPYEYGDREEFSFRDTINAETLCHTSSFVFPRSSLPSPLPEWALQTPSFDLALYNLCAGKGKLRRVPKVMSVSHRHSGGVTRTSPFQSVHGIPTSRLFMFRHLRRHHRRELEAFDEVIRYFDTRLVEILAGRELGKALAGLRLHRRLNGTLRALPTTARVLSRLARSAHARRNR